MELNVRYEGWDGHEKEIFKVVDASGRHEAFVERIHPAPTLHRVWAEPMLYCDCESFDGNECEHVDAVNEFHRRISAEKVREILEAEGAFRVLIGGVNPEAPE